MTVTWQVSAPVRVHVGRIHKPHAQIFMEN